MIKIYDGRSEFYQWDLDRQLVISDPIVNEVHFSNKMSDKALVVAVKDREGLRVADVPNILLQAIWPIRAYAYCGDCYTKECATFKVNERTKPDDYVYTETEVMRWEALEQRVNTTLDGVAAAEDARNTAEEDRQYAEEERIYAEEARREAEAQRSDNYSTSVEEFNRLSGELENTIDAGNEEISRLAAKGDELVAEVNEAITVLNGYEDRLEIVEAGLEIADDRFEIVDNTANNHEKRITNIEQHINQDYFSTVTDGLVPTNACPYAQVNSFGGITYRDAETNTLRSAKPTEIVSEGANLIPYPFDFKSYTSSGVTFTANSDQTITISGTAALAASVGVIRTQSIKAKAGETFTVSTSGVWTGTNGYVVVNQRINGDTITYVTAHTTPKTFTVEQDCDLTVTVVVVKGHTYNGSITIMLNRGAAAVPFKPYVGTVSTLDIPEEIQALEGYGEGINNKYYNKVDLENGKYIKVIDTFYFDGITETDGTAYGDKIGNEELGGSYGWQEPAALTADNGYLRKWIGEYNTYFNDVVVCDKLDYTNVGSSSTGIGIDVLNSTAGNGAPASFITIRPPLVDGKKITVAYDFREWLKANPITVKVARKVPIEMDLPTTIEPIIEVEAGGSIELANEYGYTVPSSLTYLLKEGSI